jgi:hypothetical protein
MKLILFFTILLLSSCSSNYSSEKGLENTKCILVPNLQHKRSSYVYQMNSQLKKCDTTNDFSDSIDLNFYFNNGFVKDSFYVEVDGKCVFHILADDSLFEEERRHTPFAHIEKILINKKSVISLQMNRGMVINLKASNLNISSTEVNWIDIDFKNDTLFLFRQCGSIQ